MKIDKVSFRTLRGTMATDGPFWEERLLRPIDVYEEFRRQGPFWLGYQSRAEQVDDRHYRLEATFLRIDTDQGVHGIAGPMSPAIAQTIGTQLAPLITGRDPRASEFLWDLMHRALVHAGARGAGPQHGPGRGQDRERGGAGLLERLRLLRNQPVKGKRTPGVWHAQ